METFEEVRALAESMNVKIRYKDTSLFMRVLSYLLFFNKTFMQKFTTTIGSTVYFPSEAHVKEEPMTAAVILAHELTHVQDSRDMGSLVFSTCYLLPQIGALLALFALLAITFSAWWLVTLAALAALAPWPAPGRAWAEYRGYATTLACYTWAGYDASTLPEKISKNFTGMDYFRMDPDEDRVKSTLQGWVADIESGAVLDKLPMARRLQPIFQKLRNKA